MDCNILKYKTYKHIDKKISKEVAFKFVTDKDFVSHHGFYPFLSYTSKSKKFTEDINEETKHHYKIKRRPIKYSSHIDRYIYQVYSYYLNEAYNNYAIKNDIDDCSCAYRTNKKGVTNIEISSIAFNFIKNNNDCYVLVSDFECFFDEIEHSILKKNLMKTLNVQTLPEDYYKVYKSMTTYCSIERDDIVNYLLSNNIYTEKEIKNCNSFFDKIDWHSVKNEIKYSVNDKPFGIPQGSPISGVYANIYMAQFDKALNNYAKSHGGIYLRYSDDIILIIPSYNVFSSGDLWRNVLNAKKGYQYLRINCEKTSLYKYSNNAVISLHDNINKFKSGGDFISYLGFSFDGNHVKFKDKTLTKFFRNLYKKIDYMKLSELKRIAKGTKNKTKIDKHMILKKLSAKKENRNFFSYLNRAEKVYPNEVYITGFRNRVINKVFLRFDN